MDLGEGKYLLKIVITFCQGVENLSKRKVIKRWRLKGYENIGRIFEKHCNVPERVSSCTFQIDGGTHSKREVENAWKISDTKIHIAFYKHNVYKHTEPDFWWKIKHMLAYKASLNLCYEIIFSFNLINPLNYMCSLMKLTQYALFFN